MKKINFGFIPRRLRIWAPPLIGIPAMLLLGWWSEVARYFLFTHHLFWMAGIFLLINPVVEAFWPDLGSTKSNSKSAPRPSAKARHRVEARKRLAALQKSAPASETAAERLARLQKEKDRVDKELEKLTGKLKARNK